MNTQIYTFHPERLAERGLDAHSFISTAALCALVEPRTNALRLNAVLVDIGMATYIDDIKHIAPTDKAVDVSCTEIPDYRISGATLGFRYVLWRLSYLASLFPLELAIPDAEPRAKKKAEAPVPSAAALSLFDAIASNAAWRKVAMGARIGGLPRAVPRSMIAANDLESGVAIQELQETLRWLGTKKDDYYQITKRGAFIAKERGFDV